MAARWNSNRGLRIITRNYHSLSRGISAGRESAAIKHIQMPPGVKLNRRKGAQPRRVHARVGSPSAHTSKFSWWRLPLYCWLCADTRYFQNVIQWRRREKSREQRLALCFEQTPLCELRQPVTTPSSLCINRKNVNGSDGWRLLKATPELRGRMEINYSDSDFIDRCSIKLKQC